MTHFGIPLVTAESVQVERSLGQALPDGQAATGPLTSFDIGHGSRVPDSHPLKLLPLSLWYWDVGHLTLSPGNDQELIKG